MDRLTRLIEAKPKWAELHEYVEIVEAKLESNPNLALDAAKSLIESIANTILADNEVDYERNDSLSKKVKCTYKSLDMFKHLSQKNNQASMNMLSSLANISESIGVFRNSYGFISHGSDIEKEKFDFDLSQLSIESAEVLACFFIRCHNQNKIHRRKIRYEEFVEFNDYLNSFEEEVTIMGVTLSASEFVFNDTEAYREQYIEYKSKCRELVNTLRDDNIDEVEDLIVMLPYLEEDCMNEIRLCLAGEENEKMIEIKEELLELYREEESMSTSKNVTLKCGVCGNERFEYDDNNWDSIMDADEVECTRCNKVYTPDELKDVNNQLIENEAKEIALAELKKAFKGSGIKIK
jgi:hypothetical protein